MAPLASTMAAGGSRSSKLNGWLPCCLHAMQLNDDDDDDLKLQQLQVTRDREQCVVGGGANCQRACILYDTASDLNEPASIAFHGMDSCCKY